MNYLAHTYFSAEQPPLIQCGNYIGDFIKGTISKIENPDLAVGVRLHRYIDKTTDSHSVVQKARSLFPTELRPYSGIALDIFWDFALNLQWDDFSDTPLLTHIKSTETVLRSNLESLPKHAQGPVVRMLQYRLLYSYGSFQGVKESIDRLSHRLSRGDFLQACTPVLKSNQKTLLEWFPVFFEEMQRQTTQFLESISSG